MMGSERSDRNGVRILFTKSILESKRYSKYRISNLHYRANSSRRLMVILGSKVETAVDKVLLEYRSN